MGGGSAVLATRGSDRAVLSSSWASWRVELRRAAVNSLKSDTLLRPGRRIDGCLDNVECRNPLDDDSGHTLGLVGGEASTSGGSTLSLAASGGGADDTGGEA